MALFNLEGRWVDNYNQEVMIVMNGSEFNVKPISASILPAWQAGYGEVFESGKVHAVFSGTHPDLAVQGFVSPDGQTITWNNGGYWRHRRS